MGVTCKKKKGCISERKTSADPKRSCLIYVYPVSFLSLICSSEFSLLDFLSFIMLRESARERETERLEQY